MPEITLTLTERQLRALAYRVRTLNDANPTEPVRSVEGLAQALLEGAVSGTESEYLSALRTESGSPDLEGLLGIFVLTTDEAARAAIRKAAEDAAAPFAKAAGLVVDPGPQFINGG